MDAPVPNDVFLFEDFRLDRRAGGLFRHDVTGGSTPVAIGSRALEVLSALVVRHGELVSKDEIMRAVWPGITVEEHNLTVQISALRRVLDENRAGESCIQTVSGRGYRFVSTVMRAEEGQPDPDPAAIADPIVLPKAPAGSRRPHWLAVGLGGIALAALVIAVGWQGGWFAVHSALPRLSIVVLPFQNLSDDPKDDYLADAITEDLTTDLSQVPGMFVIARQSAYTYQGKTVDVRKIGDELGVRYVIEGSVRKLGDVLRVNTQLVATESGAHLWADRFDQEVKDLSAGQEAIVRRIGQTLNVAMTDVESARSRRERSTNPDAFDFILRARSLKLHPVGPLEHAEVLDLLDRALQLDPTSLPAMTGLANELIIDLVNFDNANGDGIERAAELITKAAAISPNHPSVLASAAFLLRAQDRYTESIAAYQRLLDEYPNSHFAYTQIGMLLTFTGRSEEAIPMFQTAIRRDPRSPSNRIYYDTLGYALLMLGRDEESIVWEQRALAATPNIPAVRRAQYNLRLAAAHARLSQSDEAHRAVAEANRVWPYDTVRTHWPEDATNRVYVAQMERYQAALRFAGHRDHAEEDADFGVAPDDKLHVDLAGLTPTTVPGATTIRTAELQRFLAEQKPIVIDPAQYWWGRSISGAVVLKRAGSGGNYSDSTQDHLRRKMQALTQGDFAKPIVAVGFNSERFDGRNLALRLAALGYTKVYWYRGGREAWEAASLPETAIDLEEW